MRAGISKEMAPRDVEKPKTIRHSFDLRAGVDLDKLNQLADELEAEAAAESLERMQRGLVAYSTDADFNALSRSAVGQPMRLMSDR